ncbi:DUF2158 domain-containing protein [Azospirillum thiophilum]|uniref:DUF2158 domain-containing protein n=1 Tax=Azospirillum thiophilum TaxID=528244 RepID=UPI0009E4625B
MPEDIVKGKVVRLKSGGPNMTVISVGHDEIQDEVLAYCVWFVSNEAKYNSFPLFTLDLMG